LEDMGLLLELELDIAFVLSALCLSDDNLDCYITQAWRWLTRNVLEETRRPEPRN
jgi:hypothetical protein